MTPQTNPRPFINAIIILQHSKTSNTERCMFAKSVVLHVYTSWGRHVDDVVHKPCVYRSVNLLYPLKFPLDFNITRKITIFRFLSKKLSFSENSWKPLCKAVVRRDTKQSFVFSASYTSKAYHPCEVLEEGPRIPT